MPKRIAVQQVHVFRDKKRVVVKPDQLFEFTDDELKDIKAVEAHEGQIVRLPINEGGNDPVANAKGGKGKNDSTAGNDEL